MIKGGIGNEKLKIPEKPVSAISKNQDIDIIIEGLNFFMSVFMILSKNL